MALKSLHDFGVYMPTRKTGQSGRVWLPKRADADANWRRVRPRPLTATQMTIIEQAYNQQRYEKSQGSWGMSYGPVNFIYPGALVRQDYEDDGWESFNKALAKMEGSDGSLGIALVEAKESQRMIALRFGQIYSGMRALKRGDFRKAASTMRQRLSPKELKDVWKHSGSAASAYAEFSWGWQPLITDIGSAAKAAARELTGNSRSVRTSRSGSPGNLKSLPNTFSEREAAEALSQRFGGRGSISGRVTNKHLRQVADLGLLNPFSVAWDAVPLSFVADWGIGFGTYLGAWTATAGMTDVIACRTSNKTIVMRKHRSTGTTDMYTTDRIITRRPEEAIPSLRGLFRDSAASWGMVVSTAALIRNLFGK